MSHLNEKIAEFIFGELSEQEMADAQRHLAQCSDCREQVEQFQTTYAMLKSSPDAEPPRRILFEFEKPHIQYVALANLHHFCIYSSGCVIT